jgi:hypothetical protein
MKMVPIVTGFKHLHDQGELAPSAALAMRVLLVTELWLKDTPCVPTGECAAVLAGVSRPLIDAARVILESEDTVITTAVLNGQISLTAAAGQLRRRVRLFESFKAASAEDRAALGRLAGTATVFDDVIMPAL